MTAASGVARWQLQAQCPAQLLLMSRGALDADRDCVDFAGDRPGPPSHY
jgi:hypothetical protein